MRKEYDFSKAKRAKDVPLLGKLQAEARGKTRITIMLDNFVIDAFRQLAEQEGIGYQTLINRKLCESLEIKPMDEETLRRAERHLPGDLRSNLPDVVTGYLVAGLRGVSPSTPGDFSDSPSIDEAL
jgi:uncharacterized protein (DUF4415 family)